jgi:hypothetical protein
VFKSTKILLASYIRVRYGVTEKQIGCLWWNCFRPCPRVVIILWMVLYMLMNL